MSDQVETGLKWWLKNVIVPLLGVMLGGGGLVAVYISYREHPIVSTVNPVETGEKLQRNNGANENTNENETGGNSNPDLQKSQSSGTSDVLRADAKENAQEQVTFYVVELDSGHRSKTKLIASPDTNIRVDWDIRGFPKDAHFFLYVEDSGGKQIGRFEKESQGGSLWGPAHAAKFILVQEIYDEKKTLGTLEVEYRK